MILPTPESRTIDARSSSARPKAKSKLSVPCSRTPAGRQGIARAGGGLGSGDDYTAPTTRCTTLVPMPSFRPILRMPSPLARSWRMRASTAGFTGRRPSFVPLARALASPAFTLANNAPLELGKNAQHLKHRLAGGRRSVEALLMQEEVDALVVQPLQDAEEIRQRST